MYHLLINEYIRCAVSDEDRIEDSKLNSPKLSHRVLFDSQVITFNVLLIMNGIHCFRKTEYLSIDFLLGILLFENHVEIVWWTVPSADCRLELMKETKHNDSLESRLYLLNM